MFICGIEVRIGCIWMHAFRVNVGDVLYGVHHELRELTRHA